MDYEQLSLFKELGISETSEKPKDIDKVQEERSLVSEKLRDGFYTAELPFLGCDFDSTYPLLAQIIPRDHISFNGFGIDVAITCEMICSAICHQMNWDYLRSAVFSKTKKDESWVDASKLAIISEKAVFEMFSEYNKPNRIRSEERSMILHTLGEWLKTFLSPKAIFLGDDNTLLAYDIIKDNLLKCPAFSNDPEEKKLQLLLQKLSSIEGLSGLGNYYQPAIDYHLIRSYLRRGLLVARTKYAKEYISNPDARRKESTVAAIRQLCSKLLIDICDYSGLNISVVNQIEWHIGRSICVRDNPDCYLQCNDSQWVKPFYDKCPFFNTCAARCYNPKLIHINEPTYKGQSY